MRLFLLIAGILAVVALLVWRTKKFGDFLNQAEAVMSSLSQERITEHFAWSEYACHDDTRGIVTEVPPEFRANVAESARCMEIIRAHFGGRPVTVLRLGGWRTLLANGDSDGRSPYSQHLIGNATDFVIEGVSPDDAYNGVVHLMDTGKLPRGYVGKYATFTHYDHGPAGVDARRRLVASLVPGVPDVVS